MSGEGTYWHDDRGEWDGIDERDECEDCLDGIKHTHEEDRGWQFTDRASNITAPRFLKVPRTEVLG